MLCLKGAGKIYSQCLATDNKGDVVLDGLFEAFLFDGDGVDTGDEEGRVVKAGFVGLVLGGGVLTDLSDGYGSAADGGSGGIGDHTQDGTGGDLGECGDGGKHGRADVSTEIRKFHFGVAPL